MQNGADSQRIPFTLRITFCNFISHFVPCFFRLWKDPSKTSCNQPYCHTCFCIIGKHGHPLVPSLFQVGCMCINQCWKRTPLVDTFICESLPCIAALHLLFKKVLCHTEAIWISSSCLSWCPLILFHATGPTNLPGTNQISLKTGTEFSVFQFSGTAWVLRDVCF